MSEELKPCPFCGQQPRGAHKATPNPLFACCNTDWITKVEWNTRHITAADVPEDVKREIQAEALENMAERFNPDEKEYGSDKDEYSQAYSDGRGSASMDLRAECAKLRDIEL